MPFPRGQAGRGRKGTAPHSLTYLPVVPTAHLIGKAFAGAEEKGRQEYNPSVRRSPKKG